MYTDSYDWYLSDMRNWLNDRFLMGAFTREERKAILLTEVDNSLIVEFKPTKQPYGPDTEDKIYLMSYDEVQEYFPDDDSRICMPTEYAISCGVVPDVARGSCIWRLRVGGSVNTSGAPTNAGIKVQSYDIALRPCMWVDLNAKAFSGEEDENTNMTDFTVGEYTTFGSYEQDNDPENGKEPIDWLVLEIQDNCAIMISRYGLDCVQFHNSYAGVSWENSDLRSWLNDEFCAEAFSAEEMEAILDTQVDNSAAQNDANVLTGGENNTTDKVFLLSYQEANTLFPYSYKRICKPTAYAASGDLNVDPNSGSCMWWLRTPGTSFYNREIVTTNGELNGFGKSVNWNIPIKLDGEVAVRPVIRVDMTAKIFTGE